MKENFKKLIIIVLVIGVFLATFSLVRADSGWDTSYDTGG